MRGQDISLHTEAALLARPTPVAICSNSSIRSLHGTAIPDPSPAISVAPTTAIAS